jgi:hypothetical protein
MNRDTKSLLIFKKAATFCEMLMVNEAVIWGSVFNLWFAIYWGLALYILDGLPFDHLFALTVGVVICVLPVTLVSTILHKRRALKAMGEESRESIEQLFALQWNCLIRAYVKQFMLCVVICTVVVFWMIVVHAEVHLEMFRMLSRLKSQIDVSNSYFELRKMYFALYESMLMSGIYAAWWCMQLLVMTGSDMGYKNYYRKLHKA